MIWVEKRIVGLEIKSYQGPSGLHLKAPGAIGHMVMICVVFEERKAPAAGIASNPVQYPLIGPGSIQLNHPNVREKRPSNSYIYVCVLIAHS
jgi:hypothetical protein